MYPEQPGHQGTETSRQAAEKIAPHASNMRRKVWDALDCPRSCEDVSQRTGIHLNTVRPRMSEMKLDGMVRESGCTEQTEHGCAQVIWERVPGEEYREKVTNKKRDAVNNEDELMVMVADLIGLADRLIDDYGSLMKTNEASTTLARIKERFDELSAVHKPTTERKVP